MCKMYIQYEPLEFGIKMASTVGQVPLFYKPKENNNFTEN